VNHSAVQVAAPVCRQFRRELCAEPYQWRTAICGRRDLHSITGSSTNNSGIGQRRGSALTSSGELHIGESGAANSFTISNGGAVHGGSFAIIGFSGLLCQQRCGGDRAGLV